MKEKITISLNKSLMDLLRSIRREQQALMHRQIPIDELIERAIAHLYTDRLQMLIQQYLELIAIELATRKEKELKQKKSC